MHRSIRQLSLAIVALTLGTVAVCAGCAAGAAGAAAGAAAPNSVATPNGTNVIVQPPSTQCCSIWDRLGVGQIGGAFGRLRDGLVNRYGLFPGLEKRAPILALNDPANLQSSNPAVRAAAEQKQEADAAPQKVKAIKYLGSVGCACDPKIKKALLASLDDCLADVRMAAAQAFMIAANVSCPHCNSKSCCDREVMEKLAKMGWEKDENGCFLEPSPKVRSAARKAFMACRCQKIPQAQDKPSEGPTEGPPAAAAGKTASKNSIRVGDGVVHLPSIDFGPRPQEPLRQPLDRSEPTLAEEEAELASMPNPLAPGGLGLPPLANAPAGLPSVPQGQGYGQSYGQPQQEPQPRHNPLPGPVVIPAAEPQANYQQQPQVNQPGRYLPAQYAVPQQTSTAEQPLDPNLAPRTVVSEHVPAEPTHNVIRPASMEVPPNYAPQPSYAPQPGVQPLPPTANQGPQANQARPQITQVSAHSGQVNQGRLLKTDLGANLVQASFQTNGPMPTAGSRVDVFHRSEDRWILLGQLEVIDVRGGIVLGSPVDQLNLRNILPEDQVFYRTSAPVPQGTTIVLPGGGGAANCCGR